jgi:hypothetical protein
MGTVTNFAMHPDGRRAVAVLAAENPAGQNGNLHVTFLLNFFDEVQRRVKGGGKGS